MTNWKEISYLKIGNNRQKRAYKAIKELKIMEILSSYHPILVVTIPIEIDVEGSDLDIICEAYDFDTFEAEVKKAFASQNGFTIKKKFTEVNKIVVVNFTYDDYEFELYAKSAKTESFNGYRHLVIEARLLKLLGKDFKNRIVALKACGIKTEPAFATLLGLEGDPYDALLQLHTYSDDDIMSLYK